MTDTKRNLNLDFIRLFALLCVPCMHGLDNTGLYTVHLGSITELFLMVLRIAITVSIPFYIMLTGYLCNRKKLSLRYYLGYVRIYLIYVLCSIPCLFLEYFHKHSLTGVRDMVGAVVNFSACGYAWYIMMYTGLFIMIPFLNMMYHGCASKRQKQVLIASFFALSILPSLIKMYFQLYSLRLDRLYPICYYFTGAYLSEYMPRTSAKKAGACFFGFLAAYSVFFYFNYHGEGSALLDVYQTAWEIYILGVLGFIFLFKLPLERIPLGFKKLIMKVSDLTLATYLLTWIPDGITYPIMVRIAPQISDRYVWLLVTVPVALISAFLMAVIIDWIFKPIYRFIMNRLNALIAKVPEL